MLEGSHLSTFIGCSSSFIVQLRQRLLSSDTDFEMTYNSKGGSCEAPKHLDQPHKITLAQWLSG